MKMHRLFLAIGLMGIYGMIVNKIDPEKGTYFLSLILASFGFGFYSFTE